jgi:hypothetical protein
MKRECDVTEPIKIVDITKTYNDIKLLAEENCPACKMIVNLVQKYIGNETSVIEELVDGECQALFGKYAPFVCAIVRTELDEILKYIDQGLTSETICQRIGLCTATEAVKIDFECPACKMVVKWAQGYLGNETSVIEEFVDKECKAVFGKYAPFVCATVEAELDDILKYIELGLKPQEICELVNLCKANDNHQNDGCHTEVVCSCCPSRCEVKLVC